MKKQLFFVLINLISFNISTNLADILHEDPWEVLRYKFETCPNKVANNWSTLLTKSGAAAGSGIISYLLGKNIHRYCYNNITPYSTFLKSYDSNANFIETTSFNLALPASLALTFLSYTSTHNIFVRNIQKKQLQDFLENWDEYKAYIPPSLSEKLNKVQAVYLKNKTAIEEQADDLIDVIVSGINLHFYGDPKGQSFFNAKFFNTFMIVDIARIIESGIKGYKTYKSPN